MATTITRPDKPTVELARHLAWCEENGRWDIDVVIIDHETSTATRTKTSAWQYKNGATGYELIIAVAGYASTFSSSRYSFHVIGESDNNVYLQLETTDGTWPLPPYDGDEYYLEYDHNTGEYEWIAV